MDMKYSIGINVLLKHLAITPLLARSKRHKGLEKMDEIFPVRDFARGCQMEYPQYSFNECENIHRKLFGVLEYNDQQQDGVFSLFYKIANEALNMEGNGVSCKHSDLLSWRETVHSVGQSIFICAFLAYEDVKRRNARSDFAFSPYVQSDNMRLRNMLSMGMAENHFHLKGSAPAFLMSWVCLMNNIAGRNTDRGFKHKCMKNRFFRSPPEDAELTLCESTQIAAKIRLHLNNWLNGSNKDINVFLNKLVQRPHTWVAATQREINAERLISGSHKLDYASNEESHQKPYSPISGEHFFLYRMFHAIYSDRPSVKEMYLPFFIYLMAYMRLRAEIVQSNAAMGFQNFLDYQERKDIFLDDFPKYKNAYINMAIGSAVYHTSIKSLEARFVPSSSIVKLDSDVKKYSRISEKWNKLDEIAPLKALFFVAHLVKMPDRSFQSQIRKRLDKHAPTKSRHYDLLHGEYVRQINNIIRLRKSNKHYAQKLFGIDACSHEFHARPEVFAYLFRKARYASSDMKYSDIYGNSLAKLRITYHVGEDFFDIVSGLRAIDEAVKFLELSHGDRLGHALALGVEPAEFYGLKGNRLFLSRQELLDNLAWLALSMQKHGLFDRALESWMRRLTEEHFLWLYRAAIPFSAEVHTVTVNTCIDAWHLRGDNPKYYREIDNDEVFWRKIDIAPPYDLLQDSHCSSIRRKDKQSRQLMHHYHYNPEIRKKGEEIVELEIPKGYAGIIRDLQDAMLKDICRSGIGIETNPSSNHLIGTFRKYEKHPIVRFYNRWIDPATTSPQAFVSINTDDQGVFDTDLENEYALMASALENATDDNGRPLYNAADILNWLDDIRKMGLDQSFMLTHKHITEGR